MVENHTQGVEILYLEDLVPFGSLEVRSGIPVTVGRYISLHTQLFSDIDLDIQFQFSNDGVNFAQDALGTGIFELNASTEVITSRDTLGVMVRMIVTNPNAAVGTVFRSRTYGSFSGEFTANSIWKRSDSPGKTISPIIANDNFDSTGTGNTLNGFGNSAISCVDCSVPNNSATNNCFISCDTVTTTTVRDDFKVSVSCLDCTWDSSGGFGREFGVMAACDGSTHRASQFDSILSHDNVSSGAGQGPSYNLYAANSAPFSTTSSGAGVLHHSAILGSRDLTVHAQLGYSLLHGRNISVGTVAGVPDDGSVKLGLTVLADDSTTGALLEPIDDTFTCRFKAGYAFYSNDAIGTGVTLAAGGSAWAGVSDVNMKENVNVVDTADILAKVMLIPVNTYNFIGNDPAIVCMGPTAQDWHIQFGCDDMAFPVLDEVAQEAQWADDLVVDATLDPVPVIPCRVGVHIQALDGDLDPIFEWKPAKDILKIDTMDLMGALMASVQELQKLNATLVARVIVLEAFHV